MPKILYFSIVMLLSIALQSNAAPPACTITVESKVQHAERGKENGKIVFTITEETSPSGRFKVFLINKGFQVAQNELKDRKLEGLKPGAYEFLIVDTQGDKCFKEVTVFIREQ